MKLLELLTESRIGDFRKMLTGVVNQSIVDDIIQKDTSKNHKYLLWIGTILKMEPETPVDELLKNVELFGKIGGATDIYSFKDYDSLLDFLNKRSKEVSSGKLQTIYRGIKKIGEDKRWQVIAPKTHDASRYFGGGTSWCISTSNSEHWDNYFYKNTIVFIKDRSKKPDDKMFKVAVIGKGNSNLYNSGEKEKDVDELLSSVDLFDSEDVKLSETTSRQFLLQLPNDLIESILNYFDSDDVDERLFLKAYEYAIARFDAGGKEELLDQLYRATKSYLNLDSDVDVDDFYKKIKEQYDGDDFDDLLYRLWQQNVDHHGVQDLDSEFQPQLTKRELEREIENADFDFKEYIVAAKYSLIEEDIHMLVRIIRKNIPYDHVSANDKFDQLNNFIIKRISDTMSLEELLLQALTIYNRKYNPNILQGQQSLPGFTGIVNKFTPKNLDDIIKVLSVHPKAHEVIDWIQRNRKDLNENKRRSLLKKFYRFGII